MAFNDHNQRNNDLPISDRIKLAEEKFQAGSTRRTSIGLFLFGLFSFVVTVVGIVAARVFVAYSVATILEAPDDKEKPARNDFNGSMSRDPEANREELDKRRAAKRAADQAAQQARKEEAEAYRQWEERSKVEAEEKRRLQVLEDQERLKREAEIRANDRFIASAEFKLKLLPNMMDGKSADDLICDAGLDRGDGLSWRVHCLPLLGYQELYQRFHLDEPWDSPHNQSLLQEIPSFLSHPSDALGQTRFRSFLRLDGPPSKRTRLKDVRDGLSGTALVVMTTKDLATPWTRPDSIDESPTSFSGKMLSSLYGDRWFAIWCDGSWKRYEFASEADVTPLLTPSGGEIFSRDIPLDSIILPDADHKTAATFDIRKDFVVARRSLEVLGSAYQQLLEKTAQDPDFSKLVEESPLSWRVHLLPFLGEQELYDQFDLSKPWYDPTNKGLVFRMPSVFQLGSLPGRTPYRGPDGWADPDLDSIHGIVGSQYTDPGELTLTVVLAAPQKATIWTRPDERFASNKDSLQLSLGWSEETPVLAATAAGTVLDIPPHLHPTKKDALVSTSNGEHFDLQEALANPSAPLVRTFAALPPTAISGIVPIPNVPISAPRRSGQNVVDDAEDANKLLEIYTAVHDYMYKFRRSPSRVKSPTGEPSQLSWRVHLLPLLGYEDLYQRFNLEEPWDSETNNALLESMPDCYQMPETKKGLTPICALIGEGALWSEENWAISTDGFSQTAILIRLPSRLALPWTKPLDVDIAKVSDPQTLAFDGQSVQMLLADTSLLRFNCQLPNEVFRAFLTHSGGEYVDASVVTRAGRYLRGQPIVPDDQLDAWEDAQLKKVLEGIRKFIIDFNSIPPARFNDSARLEAGSYTLSWRVHILPYLGHKQLYNQFRFNESWDSPHNLQLLALMPDCFRGHNDAIDSTTTRFMTFTGPDTLFPQLGHAVNPHRIPDGASNTISIFQAPETLQVPWTKPEDFPVDVERLKQLLSAQRATGLRVGMLDFSVGKLSTDIAVEELLGLITPNGGESPTAEVFISQ